MPKFKVAYRTLALSKEIGKLKSDLEALARQAYGQAVVEMAAVIPVYSGESRASLLPAARLLGVSIPIFPVAASKVATGEAQGRAELVTTGGRYDLVYESTVDQLDTNNRFNMNARFPQYFRLRQPGPYGYPAIGREAMRRVYSAGLDSVLGKFLKSAQRIVNG